MATRAVIQGMQPTVHVAEYGFVAEPLEANCIHARVMPGFSQAAILP